MILYTNIYYTQRQGKESSSPPPTKYELKKIST